MFPDFPKWGRTQWILFFVAYVVGSALGKLTYEGFKRIPWRESFWDSFHWVDHQLSTTPLPAHALGSLIPLFLACIYIAFLVGCIMGDNHATKRYDAVEASLLKDLGNRNDEIQSLTNDFSEAVQKIEELKTENTRLKQTRIDPQGFNGGTR